MNPSSSHRMRPESAKYVFSSAKRNTSMRSQLKQDSRLVHTQGSTTKPIYNLSRVNAPQLKRLLPIRTDMSPERLFEQNMALKRKLNEVSDQLRLEKTKGETVERKNAKWKKRLDIEFEKEMYWGQKGEYMVMGVKNQYEKVKKMYNEKCQENQAIKRDLKYSQLQEVKAELEAYKSEAGRLRQELDKFIDIYKVPYQLKSQDERQNRLLAEELKQIVDKLEYDVETYKSGIKRLDKLVKDRDQKIQFLQKLVIDKDNYSYQLEQASKRLQHQNDNIKTKNRELKWEMEEEKSSLGQKIQDIKASEQRRLERELGIYENQLQTKTQKITKLEAEIVYLSTLLAQWRPSENDPMRNSFENKIYQNKSIIVPRKDSNAFSIIEVEDIGNEKDANELSKLSFDHNLLGNSNIIKKQKNTHYSLKRAIVKKQEIENICLEIKFRLFNEKIPISVAKSYIKSSNEGSEITIKNLIDIFSKEPFCMESEERRILLARYLIEDVNQATVYYDEQRSQSETIVRSIFEQIIPKFTIPSQTELANIKSKVSEMLTKYHVTLNQVASQYNRQLIFNQNKFIQILDEQELNLGREYNDYMISHMLKSSPDITQLNFKALLTLVAKKES